MGKEDTRQKIKITRDNILDMVRLHASIYFHTEFIIDRQRLESANEDILKTAAERLKDKIIIDSIKAGESQKVVYAVCFGNYEPPEVIAIYSNSIAAQEHCSRSKDDLEIREMQILDELIKE